MTKETKLPPRTSAELINEIIRLNKRLKKEEENCLEWINTYDKWSRSPYKAIEDERQRLLKNFCIIDNAIEYYQNRLVDMASKKPLELRDTKRKAISRRKKTISMDDWIDRYKNGDWNNFEGLEI
jgi:hypothetical protein